MASGKTAVARLEPLCKVEGENSVGDEHPIAKMAAHLNSLVMHSPGAGVTGAAGLCHREAEAAGLVLYA